MIVAGGGATGLPADGVRERGVACVEVQLSARAAAPPPDPQNRSHEQATQQLDEVFERLPPEESDVLEGAKSVMAREVMARRFPAVASQARSAARLATLEPVQQAVAAVSAEDPGSG